MNTTSTRRFFSNLDTSLTKCEVYQISKCHVERLKNNYASSNVAFLPLITRWLHRWQEKVEMIWSQYLRSIRMCLQIHKEAPQSTSTIHSIECDSMGLFSAQLIHMLLFHESDIPRLKLEFKYEKISISAKECARRCQKKHQKNQVEVLNLVKSRPLGWQKSAPIWQHQNCQRSFQACSGCCLHLKEHEWIMTKKYMPLPRRWRLYKSLNESEIR